MSNLFRRQVNFRVQGVDKRHHSVDKCGENASYMQRQGIMRAKRTIATAKSNDAHKPPPHNR